MQIVGWSGVAILLLLVTGVIAWWPRGSWAKALAFKRRAAPIRRLHDLRKLTGVGGALLLMIVTATGVILALPVVKAALLAPTPVPEPRSSGGAGMPISLHRALGVARVVMPNGRLVFIDVPGDIGTPYRIR